MGTVQVVVGRGDVRGPVWTGVPDGLFVTLPAVTCTARGVLALEVVWQAALDQGALRHAGPGAVVSYAVCDATEAPVELLITPGRICGTLSRVDFTASSAAQVAEVVRQMHAALWSSEQVA